MKNRNFRIILHRENERMKTSKLVHVKKIEKWHFKKYSKS